jgi:large subunit ribosomal protein L19
MNQCALIESIEEPFVKKDIPDFKIGDTVRVHTKIVEGSKERVQVFTGTVIARKGSGISETFSLHRVSYDEGMERVFILHSPTVVKIEVTRQGKVRRSKLYYLRGKTGKKAKVKERIGVRKKKAPAVKEVVVEAKAEAETQTEATSQE